MYFDFRRNDVLFYLYSERVVVNKKKYVKFFNKKHLTAYIILLFIFQTEVFAMSFFGIKKCVFSAVEGRVVNDGVPVANATIKRTYEWDDEDVTDEIKTDENGYFSFSEKYESSFWTLFPHNPSVGQLINIHVGDEKYQAWGFIKGNYDVNGELDGKPMNLFCDLLSPKETYKVNILKDYIGICQLQ
jgi:hypothetical protein